jgi:predicted acylesterase/phospholipase RssA
MPATLWPGVPGPAALVLSGGGTQGDFEVGVVRFLHERGYSPKLIASTSVGSVNAVKLVEGGSIDPSLLEQVWLTKMQNNGSMYAPNPDFTAMMDLIKNALTNEGQAVSNDFVADLVGLGVGLLVAAPISLPIIAILGLAKTGIDIGKLFGTLQKIAPAFEKPRSQYVLDPLINLLKDTTILDPNKVKNSGLNLLMSTVSLETGELCYITKNGDVLRSDAINTYSVVQGIDPICQPLADQVDELAQELQDAAEPEDQGPGGRRTPPATILLGSKLAQAQRKLEACQAAHPLSQPLTDISIVDGVVASAAIPMVFEPVQLGSEAFVDGGTRSAVPIGAALKNGMTNVWAVLTYNNTISRNFVSPLTNDVLRSFANTNWLDIAARAAGDILPAAVAEDDIDPPAGWGSAAVTIVQPEVDSDIHNHLTIDPGLIRIRLMHGYMRADDVNNARWLAQLTNGQYLNLVDKVSDALHTTEIVQIRYDIWQIEYAWFGMQTNIDIGGTVQTPVQGTKDPNALASIRSKKQKLEQLVESRRSGCDLDTGTMINVDGVRVFGAVPEQPEPSSDWWLQWEKHQFETPGTPWDGTAFAPLPRRPCPSNTVPMMVPLLLSPTL